MIDAPGLYAMPAEAYHADPVGPAPSLSASIAKVLVARSPRHAWFEHPRLNPAWEASEPTAEKDEGTALHALLLERHDLVEVVEAADWRKKDAQEARAAAREAGRVPLLTARAVELHEAAGAMRAALAQHDIGDFLARPGRAEQTMIWQDETKAGPIWCRSRVDWMADDMPVIFDLKTLGGSADPDGWGRKVLKDGVALQAAFYLRGAKRLGLPHRRMLFVLLERDAPHGISVCELSPGLLSMAQEQVEFAMDMWGACLADGVWPSYPPLVAQIETPTSAAYQHAEWQARIPAVRERRPKRGLVSEAFIVNSEQPFA